jgi:outer membrane protein assembly factor BamB
MQSGDAAAAGEVALGERSGAAGAEERVTFLVTALDRVTGRQLWQYELASEGALPNVHEKINLTAPSPATDGQLVYAWFGNGQIVALDLNGKLAWKRNLGTEYSPFTIDWGHGSSPVVFKDTVILVCYHEPASYLLALDSRTGKVRWKADAGRGVVSYSTPLIVETSGTAEVIVNSSESLAGHDASNGRLLWEIKEPNRFAIPMPLQHEGTIYTSRGYRSGPFMAVRPGGRGEVSKTHVIWQVPTGAPYVASLLHHDGLIYMTSDVGAVSAIDAKTGQRVWQQRIGGVFSASPVAAEGKIYLLSEDGETIVLAAGRTPRILSRNKLNGRQLASPAISGGRLFIRSDEFLYAIRR